MKSLRLTLMEVLNSGETIFIPCDDRSKQESIRSMAYQIRNKKFNESQIDFIGISKVTMLGKLFVKIHRREVDILYKLNDKGELVPFSFNEQDKELARTIMLMKQDGLTQEEIDAKIAEWNQIPAEI
jgi:hypothetical protein